MAIEGVEPSIFDSMYTFAQSIWCLLMLTLASPFMFYDYLVSLYYKTFPNELRKKQEAEERKREEELRQETAQLLLRYEELIAERRSIRSRLLGDAYLLDELARLIRVAESGDPLKKRIYGDSSVEEVILKFDISKLDSFEDIKRRARRFEYVTFSIYYTAQTLKLYGVDKNVMADVRF